MTAIVPNIAPFERVTEQSEYAQRLIHFAAITSELFGDDELERWQAENKPKR